ncbi:MAG: polysaccharide pyruvyl transferase family protein [Paludibacteraceae bacterium]|nr:polysaccharide pyruvyl transferase family protein [Paludibacteraceae bacterium]
MKIGLLAYHSACNMGATLQLLSSYCYWQKAGYEPIVINWIPQDLENYYINSTPQQQRELQINLRKQLWKETDLCRTSEEVARVIEKEKIEAVVVGSDAIAQNHPWLTRLSLDKKKLVRYQQYTHDRMFPNPFWGIFNDYLAKPVPVAILSASSQDSAYHLFSLLTRIEMSKRLQSFCYVSTRDSWTQKMIQTITLGRVNPPVTPDPVFGFNYNVGEMISSREEILRKFNLSDRYILLSFIHRFTVSQEWIERFAVLANAEGYECIMLPFANKPTFGCLPHTIDLPLSPLDWYGLIKYSSGYVGHNMHPLIVSIHNGVPFFSFDNYGQRRLNGLLPDDSSSKIKHILSIGELEAYRISCLSHMFHAPEPEYVLDKVLHFDTEKEKRFAAQYYEKYKEMMLNIEKSINHA